MAERGRDLSGLFAPERVADADADLAVIAVPLSAVADVLEETGEAGVRDVVVLTGGHRPPGSVLGAAEGAGVPVLLVTGDTLTTVGRAEDVVHNGRTRDEHTVDVMQRLLADHVDTARLLDGGDRAGLGVRVPRSSRRLRRTPPAGTSAK